MLRRPLVWVPLMATAIFAGVPLVGGYLVRARILPKVSARIGRAVTVNDVKVGLGTLELRGLVVDGAGAAPPVVIPGLRATVALSSLISGPGNVHVERLELWRPRIDVVRGESGDDNVSSILDKLREKRAGAGGEGKSSGLHVDLVRIHEGNVRLTDDALGQAEVKALDGDLRPDGPATLHVRDARLEAFGARAGADDATVDVTLAHG
ncbi:MAG: Biosynthetic peptidoglycan transglycosylase, partial [bacterium]|nr:Biosynthetic peptidoglycan transglycosylase [bacterium]